MFRRLAADPAVEVSPLHGPPWPEVKETGLEDMLQDRGVVAGGAHTEIPFVIGGFKAPPISSYVITGVVDYHTFCYSGIMLLQSSPDKTVRRRNNICR